MKMYLREDAKTICASANDIKGVKILSGYEVDDLSYSSTLFNIEVRNVDGYWSPWWVSDTCGYGRGHAIVCEEMMLYKNNERCGVRPALILSSDAAIPVGTKLIFGDCQFTVLTKEIALCDTIIGMSVYDRRRTMDEIYYDDSDLKKYVDNWFEKNMREVKYIDDGIKPDYVIGDEYDFGF